MVKVHHGLFACLHGRQALLHQPDDLIRDTALHDLFAQSGRAGAADLGVRIKPAAGDRGIADTPGMLHEQAAGRCARAHAAAVIQGDHAHRIMPRIRLQRLFLPLTHITRPCRLTEHVAAGKAMFVRIELGAAADQKIIQRLAGKTARDRKGTGEVMNAADRPDRQAVSIHEPGVQFHLHLRIGQAAIPDAGVLFPLLHHADRAFQRVCRAAALRKHFLSPADAVQRHAPGCDHCVHPDSSFM